MTVALQTTYNTYTGNGVTTVFPYQFKILAEADLSVYVAGVLKTLNVDYSVSGVGVDVGGSVTFLLAAPAAAAAVSVIRAMRVIRSTDYQQQGDFNTVTVNPDFDRAILLLQDVQTQLGRSIRTPPDEVGSLPVLPSVATRAGKYQAFDALGLPVASAGTGNDAALRADIATTTASIEGTRLIGHRSIGTGAVATSLYAALRGLLHVSMFGAVGDGATDDRAAVQAAIDAANTLGGARVVFDWGKTYRLVCGGSTTLGLQACALVKAGVVLMLNGATINCEVSAANQAPMWLFGDRAAVIGGTVNGIYSGAPSAQSFFGSAISVGVPNNVSDSPTVPSAGQFMRGWEIDSCVLSTNRQYYPAVSIMGGANAGRVTKNHIPDSTLCSGFHLDWGNTGTVSSADIPGTRTSFNAGTAYTTHPHNIKFLGNTIGTLSVVTSGDSGAWGVRASGCYNIEVDGMEIESLAGAGYVHTGGDMGFEFARPEDKRHAYQGMICRRMSVRNFAAGASGGAIIDTLGDNVFRAQFSSAYVVIANPLWHGNVLIEDCDFPGANVDSTYGVRILQARGVRVSRCAVQRWKYGIFVDEFTRDIEIDKNLVTFNREHGILVGFSQLREGTYDVQIMRNRCYSNGTVATGDGINITRGYGVTCQENVVGTESGETQRFGIRVEDTAGAHRDLKIHSNKCNGAIGAAFSLMSGSPSDVFKYRIVTVFRDNTAAFGLTAVQGGCSYLPIEQRPIGNSRQAEFLLQLLSSGSPADGIWYRGDKIKLSSPSPSGGPAYECTTGGNFRVLPAITNGSTTTGLPTFTCSLTGITVTTTQASYQVTVNSAAGLIPGMKCSIAAAGITDAVILSVSGLVLQLDTQAKSNQAAVAFSTTGLIEGEVVSINTTTPIVGFTILKITGTTVTLDANASDTQAGRTITSTAPVFKAQAAIAP